MEEWHVSGGLNFSVGQRSVAGIKAVNEDAIGIRIPKKIYAFFHAFEGIDYTVNKYIHM